MSGNLPANTDRQLGMMTNIINQLRLVWLLMNDSRVSMWAKSVVPLSLLYTISPVDFIPDVILGVGQLDDLGVILLGLALFVKLSPQPVVEFYRRQIEYGSSEEESLAIDDDDAIDAKFHLIGGEYKQIEDGSSSEEETPALDDDDALDTNHRVIGDD